MAVIVKPPDTESGDLVAVNQHSGCAVEVESLTEAPADPPVEIVQSEFQINLG
jgi:hypothetical protein